MGSHKDKDRDKGQKSSKSKKEKREKKEKHKKEKHSRKRDRSSSSSDSSDSDGERLQTVTPCGLTGTAVGTRRQAWLPGSFYYKAYSCVCELVRVVAFVAVDTAQQQLERERAAINTLRRILWQHPDVRKELRAVSDLILLLSFVSLQWGCLSARTRPIHQKGWAHELLPLTPELSNGARRMPLSPLVKSSAPYCHPSACRCSGRWTLARPRTFQVSSPMSVDACPMHAGPKACALQAPFCCSRLHTQLDPMNPGQQCLSCTPDCRRS